MYITNLIEIYLKTHLWGFRINQENHEKNIDFGQYTKLNVLQYYVALSDIL